MARRFTLLRSPLSIYFPSKDNPSFFESVCCFTKYSIGHLGNSFYHHCLFIIAREYTRILVVVFVQYVVTTVARRLFIYFVNDVPFIMTTVDDYLFILLMCHILSVAR